jgi:hypothetical protein
MKKTFSRRKFGVEIECIGLTTTEALHLLENNGIAANSYDDYKEWSVKEDGSIKGDYTITLSTCNNCYGVGRINDGWSGTRSCYSCLGTGKRETRTFKSCEIVSPILSGDAGLKEVEKVCKLLKANGVKVNSTCGLHVHVNSKDKTKEKILNVFNRYSRFETHIDKWMKASRRKNKNRYCFSTNGKDVYSDISLDDIVDLDNEKQQDIVKKVTSLYNVLVKKRVSNPEDKKIQKNLVDCYFNIDRHCKINLSSYYDHGTVEFRHHHGSIDHMEITNWIRFCVEFFEASTSNKLGVSDTLYTGISSKVKKYYQSKVKKPTATKTRNYKRAA